MGCTSGEPGAADGSDRTTQPSVEPSGADDGRIEVASLGLSLRLPASFDVVDDPDLVLLARSARPPAILSIAGDSSDVVEHDAEDGETVAATAINGVEALVVTNAVLDGLPPGIVSNELLVSNEDRSFSLILSTGEQDLPAMWDEILSSITIR